MTLRTVALCLLASAALADEPVGFLASELKWAGCYGSRASEPNVVCCLTGRSQFGSPQAAETGKAVETWLAAHPSARVAPVWSFVPTERKEPDARQVWVWLVDGDANLAVDLVAKGLCPATTMAVPAGEAPVVSEERYAAFLKAVQEAEDAARKAHAGIWGNPAILEQECLDRAERLREERKYAEASVAWQDAMKAGADAEACWMAIAECREAMGEYSAALAAYDEAIAAGGIGAIGARAHCMSRYEGPAIGAAWLQGLIDTQSASGDKAFLWSVLGLFHQEEGRWREALDPLRKAVQTRCDEGGLKFDEHDALVIDEPTALRQADDFLPAAVTIEPLATCALKAGELDEAFRVATRGVSVLQQFRRCVGTYAADEVEAGDAACRAVRAMVLARKERFDEARQEAALARLLAVRGKHLSDREAADLAERVIQEIEQKLHPLPPIGGPKGE